MELFTDSDDQDTWQVGHVINNRFEVKGVLGEGGMGRVHRVYLRDWQRDFAVKRPLPTIFARAGGKEQFLREAETWVKLEDHVHVVPCSFVQRIGSVPCIFVEYMAGGSLAELIEHEKRFLSKESLLRLWRFSLLWRFRWLKGWNTLTRRGWCIRMSNPPMFS